MKALLLAVVVGFVVVCPVLSETIILKDGSTVNGKLIKTEGGKVFVETEVGVLPFELSFIQSIRNENAVPTNTNSSTIRPNGMKNFNKPKKDNLPGPRMISSFDVYFGGDPYSEISKSVDENIAAINNFYSNDISGGLDAEDVGWGLRLGLLWNDHKKKNTFEWGPVANFIFPPTAKLNLRETSTYYSIEESYRFTSYIITGGMELGKSFSLNEILDFRMAVDLSYASGNITFDDDQSDSWTGVAWMFNPSFRIHGPLRNSSFDVGLRYIDLPKKKADNFAEFDWNPVSLYLGFAVAFR